MFSGLKETAKKNKKFRKQVRDLANISSESESESETFSEKSPFDYPINAFNFDFKSDSEVENLITDIANINLSPNMSENFNYQQLRLFLDIIPNFESDPCELNNFIAACDDTFLTFRTENDTIKKLIFRGILGKLKGKALTLISSRTELDDWDKVKEVLKLSFSDQRSFTCLLNELHSLKPHPKETPYNFGIRCQYFRSLIFTSINNDSSLLATAKIAQIGNIEKLLLVTFIKYLPHQIQTGVRLKNPTCLEEAMNSVIEEENFLSLCNETKKNSSQQLPMPSFKAPTNQGYQQTYYGRFTPQTFTPTFSGYRPNFSGHRPNFSGQPFGFRQTFPSQPINMTPRNLPEKKYFTNQQVFGKPSKTNVFKPTGQTPKETPTPMDTLSRQTLMPRSTFQSTARNPTQNFSFRNRTPNMFQPSQSRPAFQFEELYNMENPEENEQYYQNLEQYQEEEYCIPELTYNDGIGIEEQQYNDTVEHTSYVPSENTQENFSKEASSTNST